MSKKQRRGSQIEMKGPTDKRLVGRGKSVSATMPSLPTEIKADCQQEADRHWRDESERWLQWMLQSESSQLSEALVAEAKKALEEIQNGR